MGHKKMRKRTPAFHKNHFKAVMQTQKVEPLHTPLIQHCREIGNQAVQRLMEQEDIQAKLNIGQPNDKYEQEADRAADQVMHMPEPKQSPVNGHSSSVQQNASGREILQLKGGKKKKTQVKVKTERGVTKTPEERKNNFSFTAIVKVPLASGLKLGPLFFLENIKIVPKVSTESDDPIPLSEVELSALKTKVALSLIKMSIMDRTLPRNFGKLTIGATLGASSFLKYKFGAEGGLSAGIGPTLTLASGYESTPLRSPLLTLGGTLGKYASLSLAAESGVSGLFKTTGKYRPLFWAEGTAGITWKRRSDRELSVKLKIAGEAAVNPRTRKVDSTTRAFYYGFVVGGTF